MRFVLQDMLGRELLQIENQAQAGENRQVLNLRELPSGVYMLSIHSPNHTISRKIIKQ